MANRPLTIREVKHWYARYNKTYFWNSLPKDVKFKVVKRSDAHGECSKFVDKDGVLVHYQIEFARDTWYCGRRIVRIILLHEMSHLAAGLDEGHNKNFDKVIARLFRHGAYKNLLTVILTFGFLVGALQWTIH